MVVVGRIGERARKAIASTTNTVIVSAASAWEIATKVRLGKLAGATELAADFAGYIEREGFEVLAISIDHAVRAGLPWHAQRPVRPDAHGSVAG